MKLKLAFWCAVLLAVLGAHAPESALFYFFATHLLVVSAGLLMRRIEHNDRSGEKATGKAGKTNVPPSKPRAA